MRERENCLSIISIGFEGEKEYTPHRMCLPKENREKEKNEFHTLSFLEKQKEGGRKKEKKVRKDPMIQRERERERRKRWQNMHRVHLCKCTRNEVNQK